MLAGTRNADFTVQELVNHAGSSSWGGDAGEGEGGGWYPQSPAGGWQRPAQVSTARGTNTKPKAEPEQLLCHEDAQGTRTEECGNGTALERLGSSSVGTFHTGVSPKTESRSSPWEIVEHRRCEAERGFAECLWELLSTFGCIQ